MNPGITADEHRLRLELYGRGATDFEIGHARGVTKSTVQYWRKCYGIPRQPVAGPHPHRSLVVARALEHEARLALYRKGASDRAIADARGISRASIRYWRRRNGLIPTRHPTSQLDEEANKLRALAVSLGLSDYVVARMLKCHRGSIKSWRVRRGIPPSPKRERRAPIRMIALDSAPHGYRGSLHDCIADPRASEWLEEMGATVW